MISCDDGGGNVGLATSQRRQKRNHPPPPGRKPLLHLVYRETLSTAAELPPKKPGNVTPPNARRSSTQRLSTAEQHAARAAAAEQSVAHPPLRKRDQCRPDRIVARHVTLAPAARCRLPPAVIPLPSHCHPTANSAFYTQLSELDLRALLCCAALTPLHPHAILPAGGGSLLCLRIA